MVKFGQLGASSVAGQTQQLVGSEDATKSFERFYDGTNVEDILGSFDAVCEALDIHPGRFTDFFPVLRNCLMDKLSYKYKELWDMNNTKWCNGFYIEFRQSFAKKTFSYDEHLKS